MVWRVGCGRGRRARGRGGRRRHRRPPSLFRLQGVTTDDMVAALGLSQAELVAAINELLASVREEGEECWG